MKVLTTDGAILNVSRFDAVRVFRGSADEPVDPATIVPDEEAGVVFYVVGLSGLGRPDDPTRTLIAAGSAVAVLAVWDWLLTGRDTPAPIHLPNLIAAAEARARALAAL
jgi:hypothetical protein